MNFDETPYWQQYDWDFPQQVFKWYVEDTVYAGPLAISGGVKQFLVNVSCRDLFGIDPGLAVDSDSDLLLSGGVALETPVEGLELFAGYTENFKALASGPEPRTLDVASRPGHDPRVGSVRTRRAPDSLSLDPEVHRTCRLYPV